MQIRTLSVDKDTANSDDILEKQYVLIRVTSDSYNFHHPDVRITDISVYLYFYLSEKPDANIVRQPISRGLREQLIIIKTIIQFCCICIHTRSVLYTSEHINISFRAECTNGDLA